MKKLITIVLSFLFITIHSAKAEMAIGITGGAHFLEVDGTETTRQSAQKNTGSHSEDVMVPEIFVEAISDEGIAVGLSYIPTRELGSKSRTDSNTHGDSGTYKAEAELDNVVQLYVDVPVTEYAGQSVYLKGGVQHATIATLESLNSGSTYPDADVLGITLGIGVKGDLPYGNNFFL